MSQHKQVIGVFFGGKSPEHDVSIITGQLVISELKKLNYRVVPVYIGIDGAWYVDEKLGELKFFTELSQKTNEQERQEILSKYAKFNLDLVKSKGALILKGQGLTGKEVKIDVAFPCFHGENGEDGTIQGLFEMFNVAYVGCPVTASAIAIDKVLTKQFYESVGIATTKFVYFYKINWEKNKEKVIAKIKDSLQFPVFVKPSRLGSSIGMTKVKTKEDQEELENALDLAFHFDKKVLIEEGVNNLADLTCAVLGNQKPKASLIQESSFEDEMFSYEEKYLKDGGAQLGAEEASEKKLIIPANINQEKTEEIQALSKKIYKMLGCLGNARIDFLYDRKADKVYANEINPLPGTLYHHLWKETGLEINEVIEKLIKLAKLEHKSKQTKNYQFKSELLNTAKSIKLQIGDKD
jgi:D-alanine-D-alanine ligase